jgi:hypothetical protein
VVTSLLCARARTQDPSRRFLLDRASQGPEETLDPLVMSEDGKGIVMRKEDLREATKRAAERESRKLKTRLSQGEKRNRKRIATVAAVYSIERQVRMPESVEVFQEARRRDPEGKRPWVMLVDGHEGQLEDIHAAIERHGVEVTPSSISSTCSNTSGRPLGVSSSPDVRSRKPGLASGPCRSSAPLQWRYRLYWVFHKAQGQTRNHLSRIACHDFRKVA